MTTGKKIEAYKFGMQAERLASIYLRCKGYRIMAMRYQNGGGEIDIVALKRGTLVAVEVKARKHLEDCNETVMPWKQQKIARAMEGLMAGQGLPRRSTSAFAKATARLPAFLRDWLEMGEHAQAGKIAGLVRGQTRNIRFDVIWIAPGKWPRHMQDAWRM